MSNTGDSKRHRLNLSLRPETMRRLKRLRVKSEAESLTEVLRRALSLYDEAVEVETGGGHVVMEPKGSEPYCLKVLP